MTNGEIKTSRRSSVGAEEIVGCVDGAIESVGLALGCIDTDGVSVGSSDGRKLGSREGRCEGCEGRKQSKWLEMNLRIEADSIIVTSQGCFLPHNSATWMAIKGKKQNAER